MKTICFAIISSLFAAGCGGSPDASKPAAGSVVTYVALDKEFSGPILETYARETGVRVLPKYDAESTKTVGLYNLIVTDASNPGCDLFWNNEILNTLRLKKKGLLQPFRPKNADAYPEAFRDKDGTWYGFAARARVLLINTKLVAESDRPSSILELTDPKWKGKIGFAKPLFGTTATHAACLFAEWGDEKARAFYRDLKTNGIQVFSGNKQVAQAVGSGAIAVGMTDTDDAMEEVVAGSPVAMVYPDRGDGQIGTLFLPNTLAVIKGCPHPEEAEKLASHLLSPESEDALAEGPSAQIPLNARSKAKVQVETPKTVKPMKADFEKAADLWDTVAAFLAAEFAG